MIRRNHSFLRHVYSLTEMKIDDDAIIEIYHSMEKLFIKYLETTIKLCLSRGEKKATEIHLRDISHIMYTLREQSSFPDCQHSKKLHQDQDQENKKNLRILEIREQLRLLEKKEQKENTLKRIKHYKKEKKKRSKEKSKWTNKMIQSIKLLSS